MYIWMPMYSFGLGILGGVLGVFLGGTPLAMLFSGLGILIGYVIWVRRRLAALTVGKPFHVGSAINVLVCTVFAVGGGSLLVMAGAEMPTGGAYGPIVAKTVLFGTLIVSGVVVWLHWSVARRHGVTTLFPTGQELADNIWSAVTPDDIVTVTAKSVFGVAKDQVAQAMSRRSGKAPGATPPD